MTLNQTLTKVDLTLRKQIFCAYADKMAEQVKRTEKEIIESKEKLNQVEDDTRGNKDAGEIGSINNQKLDIGRKLQALSEKLALSKRILLDAVLAHNSNDEPDVWKVVKVKYKKHPVNNKEIFFIVPCDGTLDVDLKLDGITIISSAAPLAKTLLNEDGETDFTRLYMKKEIPGEIISII